MKAHTLLTRVIGDVRYTLRSTACGVYHEHAGEVRVAIVHCDDLEAGHAPRAAWGVTVRLVDGERVPASDGRARQLPHDIEREVIALLMAGRAA